MECTDLRPPGCCVCYVYNHHWLEIQNRALSEPQGIPSRISLLMLLCQETATILSSRNFHSFGWLPTFL